ncbi:MAG: DUF5024 domain-containing protein [Muribaculaceae bacterium]|nr:DUF5024 domain-containing protein [Muribaculaceae bacterium]
MKHLKLFMTLMAVTIAMSVQAQSQLTKITEELRKSPNADMTYIENRDPKTKKIMREKSVINVKNEADHKRILEAIEKERPNATKYQIVNNNVYEIRFEDENKSYKYILIKNSAKGNNSIMLGVPLGTSYPSMLIEEISYNNGAEG